MQEKQEIAATMYGFPGSSRRSLYRFGAGGRSPKLLVPVFRKGIYQLYSEFPEVYPIAGKSHPFS